MKRGRNKLPSRDAVYEQYISGVLKSQFPYPKEHLYTDFPEFLYKQKKRPNRRTALIDEAFYYRHIEPDSVYFREQYTFAERVRAIKLNRARMEPDLPEPSDEYYDSTTGPAEPLYSLI